MSIVLALLVIGVIVLFVRRHRRLAGKRVIEYTIPPPQRFRDGSARKDERL